MPADADLALGEGEPPVRPGRVFEDVAVGDTLPPIETPVLSTAHLVRWSAAIENWHRIHYDRPFAIEHDALPDVAVPGSWKQQILYRLVKDWAGPDGWVVELDYQLRGVDTPGTALVATGTVIHSRVRDGIGFVACEIRLAAANRLTVSAQGTALVALPLRGGPPVPYPLSSDRVPPDSAKA